MIFRKKHIDKLNDEQLMAALINGDRLAFSELYERYNRRLFYFFYRMLGSDDDVANDFLQDLFLKIIQKPELYKPGHKFSGWIFSVAHNMCKNEYRRREVRKHVQAEENPDQYAHATYYETADEKENLIAEVFNELELLDESQRSILILKYKENFSLKEIAEILDLPVGTIKSRLHYARLELSKRIANKESLKQDSYE
ncbi:RNA polymerase sigma factor [Maribellus sediminis]|uniref:RNA polymerase sigma factor n=1 Tax=Maribellus sediminis TaxID=2696285 RepID=UPI00143147C4|nr:RNA polymerase sigma factor [Maribellus sediminis]